MVFYGTFLVLNLIRFRLISQAFVQCVFQVGEESPLARVGKLQADEGIEAHAASAEERNVVDFSVIDTYPVAFIQNVDGTFGIHRYMQMSGQPVARATRYDTQCRFGMYQ